MFGSYSLNWIGIIVATVASFAVSMAWYSKPLFGPAWRRLGGVTDKMAKEAQKSRGKTLITSLVLVGISSFVLANFITWLEVGETISALRLALWLWLGFFVPTEASKVLWEGKSWTLYFLNVCHYLATLSVSAVILAAWQ
jgi:hypothetical protein